MGFKGPEFRGLGFKSKEFRVFKAYGIRVWRLGFKVGWGLNDGDSLRVTGSIGVPSGFNVGCIATELWLSRGLGLADR